MKGNLVQLWGTSGSLAKRLRQNPPDLIHAHYRKAALVGRILQKRLPGRIPLLYTLHLTGLPMGFPWRLLSDFGDAAHAPSAEAQRWLLQVGRMPAQRVHLLPHGIEPSRYPVPAAAEREAARHRLSICAGELVAAYVGRLEDPKNEAWLLDLAERSPALRLLIAGDGPNRTKLETAIRTAGLMSRVTLLGDCDPLPVYHAADALLLPSAREGFSYACAEAMSCGVPVLRTRTAGTEEMIIEGITGRSCEINRDAFIAAAIEFLSQPAELKRMGEAAAAHVRANLTFDLQVTRTLELYQRLIKAKS
jgi:glycosyltransferase involved in cell wall biosynthesis